MLFRPLPFLALAAGLALGSAVHAQGTAGTSGSSSSGGVIKAQILTIAGETVDASEREVGIDDCVDNTVIEVRLDGVPSDKESVDIWIGTDCNSVTNREADKDICRYVANKSAGRATDLRIELRAGDLIEDCDAEESSTPEIWFLGVKSAQERGDVGTAYGVITDLHLDTESPSAPTNVDGGSGESQIPVKWSSSDDDLDGFIVLIDPAPSMSPTGSAGSAATEDDAGAPTGGAFNGECGSNVLTPGARESSIPSSIKRKRVGSATATHVDLSSGDIDGNAAAVAVVAVDKAGNKSPLSDIACIQVVPTQGFWETYQQDSNAVDGGCPCHAVGVAHAQSGLPVMLALGFIALRARRRRTR